MRNVSDKSCRDNQKTVFVFSDFFFFPPSSKIVPLMRKCIKKYCREGQATHDRMAHAHCMLDTYGYKTHIHTGCLILIAFPQQQWLHELASLLPCVYISCLVCHVNVAHLVEM